MFVAFFIQRCVMRFIYTVVCGIIIFFNNIFCRGDTLTGALQELFCCCVDSRQWGVWGLGKEVGR